MFIARSLYGPVNVALFFSTSVRSLSLLFIFRFLSFLKDRAARYFRFLVLLLLLLILFYKIFFFPYYFSLLLLYVNLLFSFILVIFLLFFSRVVVQMTVLSVIRVTRPPDQSHPN